jgi:hypothetical protein
VQDGLQNMLQNSVGVTVWAFVNCTSSCYYEEGGTFQHHTVKCQSGGICHLRSPVKKNLKPQPVAGKVILTLLLDSQGPILEHYQEWGVMMLQ